MAVLFGDAVSLLFSNDNQENKDKMHENGEDNLSPMTVVQSGFFDFLLGRNTGYRGGSGFGSCRPVSPSPSCNSINEYLDGKRKSGVVRVILDRKIILAEELSDTYFVDLKTGTISRLGPGTNTDIGVCESLKNATHKEIATSFHVTEDNKYQKLSDDLKFVHRNDRGVETTYESADKFAARVEPHMVPDTPEMTKIKEENYARFCREDEE